MIAKKILEWMHVRSIPRLHVSDALHDDRVHKAANDATVPFAQAIRKIQNAGTQAREISESRDARSTEIELSGDRERMRAALGNILDRVGGR